MPLETAAGWLADAIAAESGLLLVLTGAGISLASGIPTFRGSDPDAIWTRDVTELATLEYFQRDPAGSWRWYRQRFASAAGAKPNAAHVALAAIERWRADRRQDFSLVTQNIDTLHEQAGSTRLAKVHGSADRTRCSRARCERAAAGTVALADLDFRAFERDPRPDTVPRCAACGGLMRPHVLWFDELYTSHDDFAWPAVVDAADRARLVLAIGTSFSVGVTDYVVQGARRRGVPVVVVDPTLRSTAIEPNAVHVPAKAEELLPLVRDRLLVY
jgi:NAD-dependent protein deacetylase/lipoamidase